MKTQTKAALLLALVASVLTGCGKSKNDGVAVTPVAPVYPGYPTSPGSNGCYNVTNGAQTTLSFAGALYGSSGIRSQMSVAGTGGYVGVGGGTYWRTNYIGDRVDIVVSGSNAYATIQIAAGTASYLASYGGGQVCGFIVDANIYNPAISGSAWSGNIGGGTISLVAGNGARIQL